MAVLRQSLSGMTGLEQLDWMDVPMRRQAELAELLRMLPSLRRLTASPSPHYGANYKQLQEQWFELRAALQQQFPHVEIA